MRNTPDPGRVRAHRRRASEAAQRPLRAPHHERARRIAVPRPRPACRRRSSAGRRNAPERGPGSRSRAHSRSSPRNGRNRRSLPATTRDTIVLAALAHVDRRYADGFALERIRGYAAEHTLNLTLPPAGAGGPPAAPADGVDRLRVLERQRRRASSRADSCVPPQLEYKDAAGSWHTAIEDIGMPVGRPQTVVVDLQQTVPAAARDVRITTTMRIYWDRALVDVSDGKARIHGDTPRSCDGRSALARLLEHHVALMAASHIGYDYDRVSSLAPWKLLPGRYTREGDVQPLLTAHRRHVRRLAPGRRDRAVVRRDGACRRCPTAGRARSCSTPTASARR